MKLRVYFLLVLMSLSGLILTGCMSDSKNDEADANQSSSTKVAKKAAKVAVKAAIRHSPAAVIKAVK